MPAAFDISARIEGWRQNLLDTSRRNRLVAFRAGRGGGLDLARPDAATLWQRLVASGGRLEFRWKRDILGLPAGLIDTERLAEDPSTEDAADRSLEQEFIDLCLRSPHLRETDALTDLPDGRLDARLGRLALAAREAFTELGVNVLYAAFGFLRWFESDDSDEEVISPLLLVPVRLERETVGSPWRLRPEEDEIRRNDTLAELLRSQFRVTLPDLGEGQPDPGDEAAWLAGYLPLVRERVSNLKRWGVLDRVALGVFNFQKLAMWADLAENAARIAAHPLCRAIAGDPAVELRPPPDLPAPEQLDEVVPPQETAQILDADSSQQAAIEAVKRGANLVLDGPPGTGKSQTIANLIAEFLAAGKTVLFVSEKTAALEVVRRRLEACRLGDFCLELHSHRASRKTVLAEFERCLGLPAEPFRDPATELNQLAECRRELNAFVRELHAPRPPLGLTAFQAFGEFARLDQLTPRSRVAIPDAGRKDAAFLDSATALLRKLPDCRGVFADWGRHPWQNARPAAWSNSLRGDIRFHLGRLAGLTPMLMDTAAVFARFGLAAESPPLPGWRTAVSDARALRALPLCPAEWFRADPRAVASAVVTLDRVSRRHRELRAAAPELDPAAVRAADPAELETAAGVPTGRVPLGQPPASGREFAVVLRDTTERLTALRARATAAHDAATAAIKATGLIVPVPAAGELAAFADRLEAVAATAPIPAGWWEPSRRTELLAVVRRAVEDRNAARLLRADLASRLDPAAFAAENSTLVKGAERYQSLFWRLLLFAGWRSVKGRLREWYSRGQPATVELLADLAKLADYHRLTAAARQARDAYEADLTRGPDGPDWDASLARLEAVDRALAPIPASAGRGFGVPDRAKVDAALATLREAAAALRVAFDSVTAVCSAAGVLDRPPEAVAGWAMEQGRAAEAERRACDTVVSLLAPGSDIAPVAVPDRLKAAAELARLSREAHAALAAGLPHTPDAALARDWAAEKQVADALLGFLRGRPDPIPAGLGVALSDPAAREELAQTVRAAEDTASGGFDDSWAFLAGELFDPAARGSTGVVLNELPLAGLRPWCSARVADADRLHEWVRYAEAERELTSAGLGTVLDEVRRGDIAVDHAAGAFRARFLSLWLDAINREVPALGRFAADDHERRIARFRDLDRRSLPAASARIRHRLLTSPARAGFSDSEPPPSSELGVLLREVHKKARHLPLRRLFAEIPTLLPRLKPCLMMSPLAVSTYLQSPEMTFDLVLFDEASQVRPHDAVCAIYRGRQLVVSGDQKQLPPTSFFERAADDTEPDEAGTRDFESVLDVCCALGLPRRRLRWHYRSRREGLIAFSNHFFYDGQLVTFPSPGDADAEPAVAFRRVPDGVFKDGQNPAEAWAVAELVFDHFRDRPAQSLGVIAFSQRQQLRILDEVERLRRERPEFEYFFRDDRDDPFFVKNLENVQGDERDVMVLSVGYGPDAAGKVAMRFGPLNRQGGERRLNVAVTRARERAVVVSSMTAADIDLTRAPGEGPRLLKAYLDYAEHGPAALARAVTGGDGEYESPFERAVGEELTRAGLTVHRQVGCGAFRIDLAVTDPDRPGRYLLGVECDGATYHSSATARDRDRLRQAVLEGLGWRICRVWSTDWARDPAGQVRRVLEAVRRAKAGEPMEAVPSVPEPPPAAEPLPRPAAARVVAGFRSIEDVPAERIEQLLVEVVARFGGTGIEDLVRRVARELGFKRTGDTIRERIAAGLNALLAAGRLRVGEPDGRVWPGRG